MYSASSDPLAIATAVPDVGDLLSEYNRAMINSTQGNLTTKFDDVRFARWAGQRDDGKKHSNLRNEGDPAWPFEGASDVRNRLIDSTCNELSSLLVTAFERATIRASEVEMQDMSISGIATTLLHWVRDNKMPLELRREAELGAQYAFQYGWTAFFVGWRQNISKREQPVTMNEIVALAQQSQSDRPRGKANG